MSGGPAGELSAELVDHDRRDGAADVVALHQDLAAAALADELVADLVEAGGGVVGAEHGDGEKQMARMWRRRLGDAGSRRRS